jgi:hypothetical protein
VPIFALLQSLLLGGISGNWLLALGYLFVMPLTFYFAIRWQKRWKIARRDQKVYRFANYFPEEWERLSKLITFSL